MLCTWQAAFSHVRMGVTSSATGRRDGNRKTCGVQSSVPVGSNPTACTFGMWCKGRHAWLRTRCFGMRVRFPPSRLSDGIKVICGLRTGGEFTSLSSWRPGFEPPRPCSHGESMHLVR